MTELQSSVSKQQKELLYPVCAANIGIDWNLSFTDTELNMTYNPSQHETGGETSVITVTTLGKSWWVINLNTDRIQAIEELVDIDHAGIVYDDYGHGSVQCKHYDDAANIISAVTNKIEES